MDLDGIEAAAPRGIALESEADQEADPLDEDGGEPGITAFEAGLELDEAGGGGEVAVTDEAAELPDGLVSDGGGGGVKAVGEGMAARPRVQTEGRRGRAELMEDGDNRQALKGGLRDTGFLEKRTVI